MFFRRRLGGGGKNHCLASIINQDVNVEKKLCITYIMLICKCCSDEYAISMCPPGVVVYYTYVHFLRTMYKKTFFGIITDM